MATGDLTTTAKLKAYLGVAGSGDDALLTSLVSAVSIYIQSWLSRVIVASSFNDRFNGPGGEVLMLPQTPITAITLLTVDGVEIPASTTDGTSGYRFDDTQIVLTGYSFTRGRLNVRVQYQAGFSVVPADLEQCANELAALVYKERDRIGQVSKSINTEVVSFFSGDLPPRIKTLLNQYKNVTPC